jgi:hypothetical protein
MNLELIYLILFFIPISICQLCGLNPPRNETDCFDNVTDDLDCCYLYNANNATCILLQDSYKFNFSQNYEFENQLYQVKCGLAKFKGQIGTECGKSNPIKLSDCHESSTKKNYCCFFNTTAVKKCFWLGEEFSREIFEFEKTESYIIKCESYYLQIVNFSYLIIISFIFLFI